MSYRHFILCLPRAIKLLIDQKFNEHCGWKLKKKKKKKKKNPQYISQFPSNIVSAEMSQRLLLPN